MTKVQYLGDQRLSPAAEELMRFDVDSIMQVVGAGHEPPPEIWLADPSAYERNGRILRDSPSSRLLAYSSQSNVVYATDGCNTCSRRLVIPLDKLTGRELETFATENEIRFELLQRLIASIPQQTSGTN